MDITVTAAGLAIASGAIVGALLALFGGGGSVLAAPLPFMSSGCAIVAERNPLYEFVT
jgi:uncharacterized membrane protein YfcA